MCTFLAVTCTFSWVGALCAHFVRKRRDAYSYRRRSLVCTLFCKKWRRVQFLSSELSVHTFCVPSFRRYAYSFRRRSLVCTLFRNLRKWRLLVHKVASELTVHTFSSVHRFGGYLYIKYRRSFVCTLFGGLFLAVTCTFSWVGALCAHF